MTQSMPTSNIDSACDIGCACVSDEPSDNAEHTPTVPASHTDSACVTGKPADDAEAFWRIRQHAANGDDGLSNHAAGARRSQSHRSNAQSRPSTAGTATTASVSGTTVPERPGSVPLHRQAAGQELTSPQTRGKCTLCECQVSRTQLCLQVLVCLR